MKKSPTALILIAMLFFCGAHPQGRSETPSIDIGSADSYIRFVEAARMGDTQTVEKMIAAGMNVNKPDGAYMTPLMHAADAGQLETARLILAAGGDPNAMTNFVRGPLVFGIASGNADVVKLLLEKGADPNPLKRYGVMEYLPMCPLTAALQWDNAEAVRLLAAKGVTFEPYPNPEEDLSALTIAASHGSTGCVKYLLDQGLDPNRPGPNSNLPIESAAMNGYLDVVRLLVEHGGNVNGISTGEPPITDWSPIPLTPLAAAAIGNRDKVVEYLLTKGADPSLLNNEAIKFADLTGNRRIYDMLRKAGAPEPASYGFLDLNILLGSQWLDTPEKRNEKEFRPWNVESVLSQYPTRREKPASAPVREMKIAIVPSQTGMENSVALLTDELSKLPNTVLLEREELRKTLAEKNLADAWGGGAAGRIRWGKLLGADVIVLLQQHDFASGRLDEAQIIETRTGLIVRTVYTGEKAGDFASQVVEAAQDACAVLQTDLSKSLLISMPQLVATSTSEAARETERQLGLLLSFLLARQPDVYLLDRKEMDQLALEKDLSQETRAFLGSSATLDGSLELPGDLERNPLTLRLRLQPGGGRKPREIVVSGSFKDPLPLMEDAVKKIIAALDKNATESAWDPKSEAQLCYEKAKWFNQARMWDQALASAEAAWALGLNTNDVLALRIGSIYNRLWWSQDLAVVQRKERSRLANLGKLNVMLRWAPLLVPRENENELTGPEYIDLANRLLDAMSAALAGGNTNYVGNRNLLLFSADSLKAATLPLSLLQPISSQTEYHEDLDALRQRLKAYHKGLLDLATRNADAEMVNVCDFSYFCNGACWESDEAAFEREVEGTIQSAFQKDAIASPHAVLGGIVKIAEPYLHMISNCANAVWARLAQKWISSPDPRLKYLGLCLDYAGSPGFSTRQRELPQIIELFDQVNAEDTAIPGWGPSEPLLKERRDIYERPDVFHLCWFGESLDLVTRWWLDGGSNVMGSHNLNWFPPGGRRILPQWREFYLRNATIDLQRIIKNGMGSLIELEWYASNGYSTAEMASLRELAAKARDASAEYCKKQAPQLTWASYKCNWIVNDIPAATAEIPTPQVPKEKIGPRLDKLWVPVLDMKLQRSAATRSKFSDQRVEATQMLNGNLWIQTSGVGIMEIAKDGRLVASIPFPERKNGHFDQKCQIPTRTDKS